MPHRNLNVICIAAFVSLLCYFANQKAQTAIVVAEALQMIEMNYVDPVDRDQLLISAMDGMTSMLDEHSEFIPREDYESFQDNINQEFAGIGIFVEQPEPEKPVRVVTPLVGSPALEAGLLPGDRIIRVNGEDVSSMDLREVSSRLKGQVGTTVDLIVLRGEEDSAKEVRMTVRRGRIALESVIGDYRDEANDWVYRLRDEPSIAYVRLTSFGEKTVEELESVLQSLDNDFAGLVLDLRGNGGGLLNAAVDVTDMFLHAGPIVSTRTRGGKIESRFDAAPGTLVDTSKPVAILIDNNSASASEIVAAALQDNGRAAIVGTRSYGKGTVQNILPLQFGRSALRLTVARYYRPTGKNIHRSSDATEDDEWGVTPDDGLQVEIDTATLERLAKRWREASYPSLATEPPQTSVSEQSASTSAEMDRPDQDSAGTTPEDQASGGEMPSAEDVPPAEDIDPQLRRAVEHLREVLNVDARQPAAA